jgi:hypothetical protein
VADPVSRATGRLDEVLEVGGDRAGLLPAGAPVPAEVEGADPVPGGQSLLGEPAEAASVPGDAVEADDGRSVLGAPVVLVEEH